MAERRCHKTLGEGVVVEVKAKVANATDYNSMNLCYFKPDVQKPGYARVILVDSDALFPCEERQQ